MTADPNGQTKESRAMAAARAVLPAAARAAAAGWRGAAARPAVAAAELAAEVRPG